MSETFNLNRTNFFKFEQKLDFAKYFFPFGNK